MPSKYAVAALIAICIALSAALPAVADSGNSLPGHVYKCTPTGPVCFLVSSADPFSPDIPNIMCGSLQNASPPVLSGTGQPGNTLSLSDGTWRSSCSSVYIRDYSWNGSNGSGNTYSVQASDVGSTIVGTVTACDDEGCLGAQSNGITITMPGDPPPPPAAPSVNLTASPNPINPGESSSLQLSSNAASCGATAWNPGPTPKTNGSFSTGILNQTTTFSIICYNSVGASASASVEVDVNSSGGGGTTDSDLVPGPVSTADDSENVYYDYYGNIRCKTQYVSQEWDQAKIGKKMLVEQVQFRVCYRSNGGIVGVHDLVGDATYTFPPWQWNGTDDGYPYYRIQGNGHEVYIKMQGAAQINLLGIGIGPNKHFWFSFVFHDNNTLGDYDAGSV